MSTNSLHTSACTLYSANNESLICRVKRLLPMTRIYWRKYACHLTACILLFCFFCIYHTLKKISRVFPLINTPDWLKPLKALLLSLHDRTNSCLQYSQRAESSKGVWRNAAESIVGQNESREVGQI